jgi:HEAT repeat protein
MRSLRALLVLTLSATLVVAVGGVASTPARAQSGSNQAEEWFEDLLLEGRDKGDVAAFELFTRQIQPTRLRTIMADKDRPQARLCILRALKWAGRQHPRQAFDLTLIALGDPDSAVHREAARSLGFLEDPYVYDAIGRELAKLSHARPETRAGRRARGLVAGIERLRYPMRATGVLVRALSERMEASLEQHVRKTLERVTGQRFTSVALWAKWWKTVQDKELTPSEWRHEVVRRRWDAQKRVERTAEELYGRLLTALQNDPQGKLKELARGLHEEQIPGLCRRAVFELGRMGRMSEKSTPERERAIQLLVERLKQGKGAEFDPVKAEVIRALGQTRDPALLADLRRFLHHDAPRMRVAAVNALAELGSPDAVGALLDQIDHEDVDLARASIMALGRIGVDAVVEPGPPPAHVSDRLVTSCLRWIKANGDDPNAPSLLAAAAWSLGALRRGKPTDRVVDLLAMLVDYKGTNVRFEAVSALGPLPHPHAFAVLHARLNKEPKLHVRKEILGAIGRQARGSVAHMGSAVKTLVPFLFTTREDEAALKQVSQDSLVNLAKGEGFVGLEAIVSEIDTSFTQPRGLAAALSFLLRFLPEPASDRVGKLKGDPRERYFGLLGRRAALRLKTEPAKALTDFSAALSGSGLHTVTAMDDASFTMFLGKARALLAITEQRPREALLIAEACLKHRANEETWGVTLDALEAVKTKAPADFAALVENLAPRLDKAPKAVKERFEGIRRPAKPAPKPSAPPSQPEKKDP